MSNFYTILTNIGAALHANAQVQQTTVAWTHMALGDGNGNPVVPQQTQTGLVREVHRLPITSLEQHPDNPNWIVVEAVVPSDVGGWTVRETALYGGAGGGSCIAVGNYPATYKPVLAEGAAREMVMRMVVEISSVATVKLQIDPAVAIASRAWVESLVATPAKAGLVKLANEQEHLDGLIGNKAATPAGVKAAIEAFRWPFAKLAGTQTLAENAFGIYELADGDVPSTFTLPSLSVLSKDTELLLFANHANEAAIQVKAATGDAVQGPAALMDGSTTAFMLPAGGDWVRLRSEKAQGRWVVVAQWSATRIAELENIYSQYEDTDSAILTSTDNKIVFSNIVSRVKVEKGDVVRIVASEIGYDKLHTVESIINSNEIVVNYEHCGSRGNGPLKLPDYTGTVAITRVAKWYNAADGLGQDWVAVSRVFAATYSNNTNRSISISMYSGQGHSATLTVNGVGVSGVSAAGVSGSSYIQSLYADIPMNSVYVITSISGLQIMSAIREKR